MKRLLIVLLAIMLLTGCIHAKEIEEPAYEIPSGYLLVSRSYTEEEGFKYVYSNGNACIDDKGEVLSGQVKTVKEIIPVQMNAKPATEFSYYSGSQVINPLTLGNNEISLRMPYNYTSTVKATSDYLSTLIADGWDLKELEHTPIHFIGTFSKEGEVVRVVVTTSNLKIYAKFLQKSEWRGHI